MEWLRSDKEKVSAEQQPETDAAEAKSTSREGEDGKHAERPERARTQGVRSHCPGQRPRSAQVVDAPHAMTLGGQERRHLGAMGVKQKELLVEGIDVLGVRSTSSR